MLLCNTWRTFMNQQIAHCYVSITQVRAEEHFAKVFHELIACRMATEKLTPLMTRAVKSTIALINIIDQCAEEGRAQLRFIMAGSGF
ncbi:hypothetical protein BvCmsSINP002_01134 [Escherichia coli]|nr:Uncharacterised protein [Escherichia coli]CAD6552368.1 Uncharacterised protein [Escherichia coli]CAD6554588.1 Uncharacterised protein [Escherichia coli]SQO68387.1 Uncharacterised protein [Escherichia coli]GCO90115.1 hypothetical protein BvCms325_03868 [Escherichia coli]